MPSSLDIETKALIMQIFRIREVAQGIDLIGIINIRAASKVKL